MVNKPKYTHDCNNCDFLGTFNEHDLYVCAKNNIINTVIARYGSDGPDYCSGLAFAQAYKNNPFKQSQTCECLYVALVLAKIKGYKIKQ